MCTIRFYDLSLNILKYHQIKITRCIVKTVDFLYSIISLRILSAHWLKMKIGMLHKWQQLHSANSIYLGFLIWLSVMIMTGNVCERCWHIIPSTFNELRNHVCDRAYKPSFWSFGNPQRLRVLLINFLSKFRTRLWWRSILKRRNYLSFKLDSDCYLISPPN